MPNSKQYVEEFGRFSFAEHAFCDADALTMCFAFYMPLEWVASNEFGGEKKNFSEACSELFSLRGGKHKALGLMITKNPSRRLMQMASTVRYSEMKIDVVQEVYTQTPTVQYCAGNFILPDGTNVIVFRGTDDTIVGWKEDLEIFTRKGTHSYDLAMDFINNVAASNDGDIIVCGHSKGGNIALRTACRCSDDVRARIRNVYNFDGPGYSDYSIFNTKAYSDILPGYRHYVPSSSFIGMLLDHDYDYKAVKSTKHFGATQHDLGSWQIKGGKLVTVKDTDILSKFTDEFLSDLMEGISAASIVAIDIVVSTMAIATGSKSLTDLAKNAIGGVSGAVKAYKGISPETKEDFKDAFKNSDEVLKEALQAVTEKKKEQMAAKA